MENVQLSPREEVEPGFKHQMTDKCFFLWKYSAMPRRGKQLSNKMWAIFLIVLIQISTGLGRIVTNPHQKADLIENEWAQTEFVYNEQWDSKRTVRTDDFCCIIHSYDSQKTIKSSLNLSGWRGTCNLLQTRLKKWFINISWKGIVKLITSIILWSP